LYAPRFTCLLILQHPKKALHLSKKISNLFFTSSNPKKE
jgi:hypothetical protein